MLVVNALVEEIEQRVAKFKAHRVAKFKAHQQRFIKEGRTRRL